MNSYTVGQIVKLKDGREVKILKLPTSFMANGSYEVGYGVERSWVKPEMILYSIDTEWVDDINNYFEIIMDENGVNLVPKGLSMVELESDREDIKRIKLTFTDGRKHGVSNIHIGDVVITDKERLVVQPEIEKEKTFIEKLGNIVKGEDEQI